MNRTEYIQQRAAIDEAARKIALDLIREQFPDVEAVPFAEGEGMELPAHLAWRQEADAARMGALAECLRGSR